VVRRFIAVDTTIEGIEELVGAKPKPLLSNCLVTSSSSTIDKFIKFEVGCIGFGPTMDHGNLNDLPFQG